MTVESILLSLASAVIGGLVVAFANHWMTRNREKITKNREIVLTKLVRAWELLDDASEKGARPPKLENFQEIVQLLLLYGTPDEFQKIDRITQQIIKMNQAHEGRVEWGDLQRDLRNRIRKELGLETLEIEHRWFLHENIASPTINSSPSHPSPKGEG